MLSSRCNHFTYHENRYMQFPVAPRSLKKLALRFSANANRNIKLQLTISRFLRRHEWVKSALVCSGTLLTLSLGAVLYHIPPAEKPCKMETFCIMNSNTNHSFKWSVTILSSFNLPWHYDHQWMSTGKLSASVSGKRWFFHTRYDFNRLQPESFWHSLWLFYIYTSSVFYFLFSLFRKSFCFQQDVFSPPFCDKCRWGTEGKRLLKSFHYIVCFHCYVLKQSPLLFTNNLSFSNFFFAFSQLLYFFAIPYF